jgi:hypothetical protein
VNARLFKSARLFGGAGGILGVVFTVFLLVALLIPQWMQQQPLSPVIELGPGGTVRRTVSPIEYSVEMAAGQLIFFGGPTLASIASLATAWLGEYAARRRAGAVALAAALVLIGVGLVGWFGVSVVFLYLPVGLVMLVGAVLFLVS